MAEPSYEDVITALRAADAAGNKEDAAKLAAIADRLSSAQKPQETGSKYNPNQSELPYQANRFMGGVAGLLSLPAEGVYWGAKLQNKTLGQIPLVGNIYPDPDRFMMRPGEAARQILTREGIKPPSRNSEIVGGISEFAGSGIVPGAAVVSRAAQKIPAVAAEIGATVLGGVGSEVAGLPGAIIGSIMGSNTPTLIAKGQAVLSGAVPWLKSKAQQTAPRDLQSAMEANPSSAANAQQAQEISGRVRDITGTEFRPTLGQTTGAPGIIAREEQIASSTPEQLSRYAGRRTENEAVLGRAVDAAFPKGSDISRAADAIGIRSQKALNNRLDSINKSREILARRMEASPQESVGNRLRELRDEAQNVARGIKNAKIEDVYQTADRLGISDKMDDVLETVRKIGGSDENIFQNMPPIYGKILNQYAPKTKELTGRSIPPDLMTAADQSVKPATFRELHSLWRETNSQYATALRSGDAQSQYYLQQIRDSLRAKLDKFERGGYAELTEKFKDFNKFYAEKYAPSFKEGVGGRMAGSGKYGETMKPEDVVKNFLSPSGIDDFNLIYGSNKDAQTALTDGIVGLFKNYAVRDGKINSTAAKTFLRNNGETLDKIPDIKALLQNPSTANDLLAESAARTRNAMTEFNNSAIARIAKTENPAQLIDRALANPVEMRRLFALGSGKPEVTNQVMRSIADRIPEAARREGLDPLSYVMKNESTLRPAMERIGKEHFENLKTIAGARTILGRTEVPPTVGATRTTDIVEQVTGSTPRTVWAQAANTAAGRQSGVSAVLHLLSRYGIKIREQNADRLMSEAIYNPEIASTWANMAKGQKLTIPESNRFRDHLLSSGIRILSDGEE